MLLKGSLLSFHNTTKSTGETRLAELKKSKSCKLKTMPIEQEELSPVQPYGLLAKLPPARLVRNDLVYLLPIIEWQDVPWAFGQSTLGRLVA